MGKDNQLDMGHFYKYFFEEAPLICWKATKDGKRYYFNRAWYDFIGENQEDVANQWLAYISDDDRETYERIYNQAIRSQESFEVSYKMRNGKGEYRTIVDYGKPLKDEQGNCIGFVGSCIDMTVHIENEISIKQDYEEIYQSLYENNLAVILLVDPKNGQIVDANPSACHFYGYSKEELIKKNIADLNMLTKAEIENKINIIQTGSKKPFYLRHRIASGEIKYVEAYTGILHVKGRELVYGLIHDITNRSKKEEALNVAYSELNQIFNTAANGMRIIGLDFKVIKINDAMVNKLGLIKEEAIGKNCYDVFPGDHCLTDNCPIYQIKNGVKRLELESEKTLKDGTKVPCQVTATPFFDYEGNLIGIVEDFKDISDRKKVEERIKQLAFLDPLTNLANRMLFTDRLELALKRVKESDKKLAVMFLDLDEFKYINDTYGHAFGDNVLIQLGNKLSRLVKTKDTVARLGGDEFNILISDIDTAKEAANVANTLLEESKEPLFVNGIEIYVTLSIGVSIYPYDGDTVEALMKHADIALYHAKVLGKNNCQFFNINSKEIFAKRFILENNLRHALEKQELELHYQPQVNIESNEIIGVEALIRWNSANLGQVSPTDFIPIAEDIGLIVPIGKWVLHEAALQIKEWEKQGLPPIRVSINLSVRQLQEEGLVEDIKEILDQTEVNPRFLELEITESIALKNFEENINILNRIKELGIQISLDDFGTGYASLSYLKVLPLDILKIDKAFIQNLSTEQSNRAILTAIISLAHSLNLKVIAEGVETEEQLDFLRNQNCDIFQGYFYSKPLPAKEIIEKYMFIQATCK